MLSPRQKSRRVGFGRTLKDFFPRHVPSLLPIPENWMTGQVKDMLQEKIRKAGGDKWSEHTRVLPPLELGQWVQLQNLKGRYPLKSDNSGIIVGKHNENSYAVKVNGSGNVTVRNRVSLRKIPTPVQIVRPVTMPGEARPASEPGSVPSVPSRVTRASLTRQDSLLDGASSQTGKVPSQNSMKPASQTGAIPKQNVMKPASRALHEEVCERTMRQVADWDIPGNILYEAFHKSPAKVPNSADVGERGEPVEGLPVPGPSSPRGQPAGARSDSGSHNRSGSITLRDSNGSNGVMQDYGLVTRPSPQVNKETAPGPQLVKEVGPQIVRQSVRQKAQVIPFQAGQSGMELKLDTRV